MVTARPKTIRLTNTEAQPLSETQIVEATIAFANGANLEIEGLTDAKGRTLTTAEDLLRYLKFRFGKEKLGPKATQEEIDRAIDEEREDIRQNARQLIAQGLADPHASAKMYIDSKQIEIVARMRARIELTNSGLAFRHYYAFEGELQLFGLGQMLLLDSERGYGAKLCQCKLLTCGKFFFEVKPPTGRPQRNYCCREHMLEAHAEDAARRVAKSRKKAARAK